MCVASECAEMSEQELDELLDRIRGAVSGGAVSEEDYKKLEAIAGSLVYVTRLVEDEGMTLRQLRSLILRKKSEKTRKVLERAGLAEGSSTAGGSEPPSESAPASADPTAASTNDKKPKAKGHGRNGASAYRRAERIAIPHGQLESGASCPKCPKGKVYAKKHASQLVRIVGQAPLHAKVYELERLRCNLCGEVFTAEPPAGVGDEKYDPSAKAMIGLLKYGTGLPFYRLDGLQASLGVPLPDTTQWDVVSGAAMSLRVVYDELVRQAAQGEVLYNDDTSMRILALMKENQARLRAAGGKSEKVRTGIFTTGIVATTDGDKIALFFTGRQHAGENLTDVLKKRAAEREPPIQMCDASSRNLPQELEVIVANCIVHGRRHFVDVIENFPEECRHVLEALAEVPCDDRERVPPVEPTRGEKSRVS